MESGLVFWMNTEQFTNIINKIIIINKISQKTSSCYCPFKNPERG
jgi:hypothetical protein